MLLLLMSLAGVGGLRPERSSGDWDPFIKGIAMGDENALASLYDASSRLVYSVVLRMVGNNADADEVVQDVYAQAWRSARDFSLERGSASSWLVMMARSRALDKIRSRGTRSNRETTLEEVANVSSKEDAPESVVMKGQTRSIIRSAMDALVPEQRQAIEMSFFMGLTHSELAEKLGQPLGTIKTRIRLGMNKLRQSLAVGGLAGEELQELQSRIDRNDPECMEALREAKEWVSQLGHAAPLAEPPALLRSKILNAARAEKRSAVQPIAPKSNWASFIGWAAAAALLVATLINRNDLNTVRQDLADARESVSRLTLQSDQYRKVAAILMSRDAQMIRLTTSAPEAPQFRAYWSKESGLVLAGNNVKAPATGRTMQLWVVPKTGQPISAGVFAPDAGGQVILIAESLGAIPENAAALAISDEPTGGSAQPTTTPAWVGKLGD
jgi:RNA polymerase sigma-70 factor (ECF subfamily)